MIPLHWVRHLPNFGDALAPWLFEQIVGEPPAWSPLSSREPHLAMIGSFLGRVSSAAMVWGAGVRHAADQPNPAATYAAVRGPLSRQAVLAAGGECPEVYGDPVSLLPWFRPLNLRPQWLGVIPHWREKGEPLFLIDDPHVRVLDAEAGVDAFLDALAGCEVVLSSSLHGLVAAHAYGIPAAWIRPTAKPLGDGTKFRDYLASVELPQVDHRPTDYAGLLSVVRHTKVPRRDHLEVFADSCPLGVHAQ